MRSVRRGHRGGARIVELEARPRGHRRSGHDFRRVETDRGAEQRRDRGIAHRDPASAEGEGEAAGAKETRALPDVVRESLHDEHMNGGDAALLVVLGPQDAADAHALILHRRADGHGVRARGLRGSASFPPRGRRGPAHTPGPSNSRVSSPCRRPVRCLHRSRRAGRPSHHLPDPAPRPRSASLCAARDSSTRPSRCAPPPGRGFRRW